MLTISDFQLDDVVVNMFVTKELLEEPILLENLERYRFVERSEILEAMRKNDHARNGINSNKRFADIPEIVHNMELVHPINQQVAEVEAKYPLKVKVVDSSHAIFYVSVSMTASLSEAELSVSFKNLEVVWITKVNYERLAGIRHNDWDFDLMFKRITYDAVTQRGVTDIHLLVIHKNLVPHYLVRFRKDNFMEPCDLFALDKEMHSGLIYHLIGKKTNTIENDLEMPQGVTTAVYDVIGDGNVQMRVQAHKVIGGFKCVCRLQEWTTVAMDIEDLGFNEREKTILHRLTNKPTGLTLIGGQIRSGKNTTAFAVGNEMIQNPAFNIVDYSSPVEVLMPFPQTDYNVDTSTLLHLVRMTKKSDVNVVFINEIPDADVAQAMVDLVYSGLHVITTTHIDRVWHLPHRLYKYFGSDFRDILTQMNVCITQKMFNVRCPHCSNEAFVKDIDDERIRGILLDRGVERHKINEGCSHCINGRLLGKVQPYIEVLELTPAIKRNLLKFSRPSEMEEFIRNYMDQSKITFEDRLAGAIATGDLSVSSLLQIV